MKHRDLGQSVTFPVIAPAVRNAEGATWLWERGENNVMKRIECAAIRQTQQSLDSSIDDMEKVFGRLHESREEGSRIKWEILAFRNLLECIRHGKQEGWENYLKYTVQSDYGRATMKAAKGGSWLEKFTSADLEKIIARKGAWDSKFPRIEVVSRYLWDNDSETGLTFVIWEKKDGTASPAIFAPDLKLALFGYFLAQMSSPKGAWALCPICGKDFERSKRGATYCSDSCGWTARKRRQRSKEGKE